MNEALVACLRCPLCGAALVPADRALRCAQRGHSFDIARQGYAHLGAGRRLPTGDSVPMVAARAAFLAAGHYAPLAEALAAHVPEEARLIVDVGAGTGYYLAHALNRAPAAHGFALDVSKPALRRAAACHPRAGAVLTDTWGTLPLVNGCADVLLNVFAPRNGPEFARTLARGGLLLVVTPEPQHLSALRPVLRLLGVDPAKDQRLATTLSGFVALDRRLLRWPLTLDRAAMRNLVAMGPTAHHVEAGELDAALARLPEHVVIEAAVRISAYALR